MKPRIYKYSYKDKTYYAEGYDEGLIRLTLENYLQIKPGTLNEGVTPNFNSELKLIWNKKNTTHVLTLTKEQTTSREQLRNFKNKQHCLYELKLLLREDAHFLNSHNGHVIANEENEVKFWNSKYITDTGEEIGHEMCYSFQGSTDPDMTDRIFRFKNLAKAYKHVRSELIKYGMDNEMFNKNVTNLEMCDSFLAGFGSADIKCFKDGKAVYKSFAENNYNNRDFNL